MYIWKKKNLKDGINFCFYFERNSLHVSIHIRIYFPFLQAQSQMEMSCITVHKDTLVPKLSVNLKHVLLKYCDSFLSFGNNSDFTA